jgi:hypothetical protein
MNSVRFILSAAVIAVLGAGYLASQYFWFNGEPAKWTATIDTPPVVWAALLVFLGSIALAFVKEKA